MPDFPPYDERMTEDEVAQLSGYSAETVKRFRSPRSTTAGPVYWRIPHKGKRICYWRRDVDAWLASLRVTRRGRG